MPVEALTSDFLASLHGRPPAKLPISYFDRETRGFFLEHRPSGGATFYFRYRDQNGKIRLNHIGRLGDISLADARAQAYQMRRLVMEGGDPKRERNKLKDIPDLATFIQERYLPYAQKRKRGWVKEVSHLRTHILPAFGQIRMNRLARADVLAFHHRLLEKGYKPGTCNRILAFLKIIFNCAIRWEVLPSKTNPCDGVKPFDDHGGRERYLTKEEVDRLFDELDRKGHPYLGQYIRLLLYTGARRSEILEAAWEEIDFERRLLTVPAIRSKSKKPRHIPLSDAAIELLRSLPREADNPWVFMNPKTRKPPGSVFFIWNDVRKKAGLGELRLHDLRHSFASFLVNAGRSLYEVQKILGHHDPKVTMRYAHLSPNAMLEAANVVGHIVSARARTSERPAP